MVVRSQALSHMITHLDLTPYTLTDATGVYTRTRIRVILGREDNSCTAPPARRGDVPVGGAQGTARDLKLAREGDDPGKGDRWWGIYHALAHLWTSISSKGVKSVSVGASEGVIENSGSERKIYVSAQHLTAGAVLTNHLTAPVSEGISHGPTSVTGPAGAGSPSQHVGERRSCVCTPAQTIPFLKHAIISPSFYWFGHGRRNTVYKSSLTPRGAGSGIIGFVLYMTVAEGVAMWKVMENGTRRHRRDLVWIQWETRRWRACVCGDEETGF
ncbi:hypothetical protein JB92DRAFT_2836494 [Gautieria morchelliformis]|nr:hypothetical protein JB92DRAFT_2836494 [Gautieria morchelliformis]